MKLSGFLLTMLGSTTLWAADVGVLVVGDNKQYVAAGRAAAAALSGAELVTLPVDAPLPDAWRRTPPRIVVAVGVRAVRLALSMPEAEVVAAMVLQESAELDSRRVRSLPLAAPLEDQLRLLTRLAPQARRVGLVIDPRHSSAAVAEARAAAVKSGHTIVVREVQDPARVNSTFDALFADVDALLLVADTTVVKRESLEHVVTRALDRRLLTIGYSGAVIQHGLLAGYAVEPEENGAAAAALARARLAGATRDPPRPIGRLHVNAKTARVLGLALPTALLAAPTVVYDAR